MDHSLPGFSGHGISQARNIGMGCRFLLQGIFLTQGSNSGLLHCRQILYCLSYQGSPLGVYWGISIMKINFTCFCGFTGATKQLFHLWLILYFIGEH